jgi:hypothetical protein
MPVSAISSASSLSAGTVHISLEAVGFGPIGRPSCVQVLNHGHGGTRYESNESAHCRSRLTGFQAIPVVSDEPAV